MPTKQTVVPPTEQTVVSTATLPLRMPVRDACRVSGLAKTQLYNRLNSGEIVAYKLGRATLVDTASLLQFLADMPKFGQ